ncbi:unnamed protein product [Heterobilharzia americana]|nr:unnamed protein product [Heterobilharzia americana]
MKSFYCAQITSNIEVFQFFCCLIQIVQENSQNSSFIVYFLYSVVFICFRIRMRIILAVICALLMFWTRESTAQSETQSNDYLQVYDEEDYGENPQNEVFRNKGKNLDLYDRYRIRRQFRPQRFGKRHMGFTPQRFGKRTHERMNL